MNDESMEEGMGWTTRVTRWVGRGREREREGERAKLKCGSFGLAVLVCTVCIYYSPVFWSLLASINHGNITIATGDAAGGRRTL